MTSNFAAREAAPEDLDLFAMEGDWSQLGLAIQRPETVYTAVVDGTPDNLDGIAEFAYTDGVGNLSDIFEGMTMYIDSVSGERKGVCRVRKIPTEDIFYINQVSDIDLEDGDVVTVKKSFWLWQRDATLSGNTLRMDYDIDFGSYLNKAIMPRVAPMAAVLHLADGVDGVVSFAPPTPTTVGVIDEVFSYLYDAPGAINLMDMDTDHPSWDYDTAGDYLWSCTITSTNGNSFTTFRWVLVDPAPVTFTLEECSGNLNDGDWSFKFRCLDDASEDNIPDRALVTLYSKDYYDNTRSEIGKITGYENIWMSGWIDGDETEFDSETGEIVFTVYGAAHWLKKIRASVFAVQDVSDLPASWAELQNMTVDKALAHLLFWTTTAPLVMDIYLSGNETRQKIFSAANGYVWDQLEAIAGKIFATVLVNNYGQMYVEVDTLLLTSTDRNALPVVMDIEKKYRNDKITIERGSNKKSMIELGAEYYDGVNVIKIYSRAPGNVGGAIGDIEPYDDYMIESQEECNRMAGQVLAMRNNRYEPIEIKFPALIRLFDICPRMFATISIDAGDNPRGITMAEKRLLPRTVRYTQNYPGIFSTEITFEVETNGRAGVTYIPPTVADDGLEDSIPDDGYDIDFPNPSLGDFFPPSVPDVDFGEVCTVMTQNSFIGHWSIKEVRGEDATKLIAKCYFPCVLHGDSNPANYVPTKVIVNGIFGGDAATNYTLYAIKSGARVATGTQNGLYKAWWTFPLTSPLAVDGFEIELASGIGPTVTYTPLDIVATGTVNAVNNTEASMPTTVGEYYCIEGSGGPFYVWEAGNPNYFPNYYFVARDSIHSTGRIGHGYDYLVGSMFLDVGSLGLHNDTLNGKYARVYFLAAETSIIYKCANDPNPSDNTGTITCILRTARVDGRRILLNSATINNVCGS